jgi:hypothetical protein
VRVGGVWASACQHVGIASVVDKIIVANIIVVGQAVTLLFLV